MIPKSVPPLSQRISSEVSSHSRSLASRCLLGGLVLMPLGFFLGGCFIHDGDPGLGVLLAPPGALLLLVALFLTARATGASDD